MTGESTGDWPQFPFCSSRCKTIDLGRWLGETYRADGEPEQDAPPGSAALEERELP
jgi:endogenous inhibitor of DNA gyrase (YacG/DUF329 family)